MTEATNMGLLELPDILPPGFDFAELRREIAQAAIPWTRHYGEYQSGDWWTCALLGRSGDATDGIVADAARPVVTDALERLPATCRFLQALPLRYMIVRLARLDPGGALWEHKDYQDLKRVARQRIHLPLETNSDAFLVSAGRRFHMAPATLWTFRPTKAHGACNAGYHPRVHIILDVYEDEPLKAQLARAVRSPSAAMPPLSGAALADEARSLRTMLAGAGDAEACRGNGPLRWERAVLDLYFAFKTREGELYHALERECLAGHDRERAAFWAARRRLVLGKGLVDA